MLYSVHFFEEGIRKIFEEGIRGVFERESEKFLSGNPKRKIAKALLPETEKTRRSALTG